MNASDLLTALLTDDGLTGARSVVEDFEDEFGPRTKWVPVGGRENNVGTIEVAGDPGRSLVERLTNGIDAVLEAEHDQHHGLPDCRSPREAAVAWLSVPPAGLSALTPTQRRNIARRVSCTIMPGEGPESRVVEVRDQGIGIAPSAMGETILSLNQNNKIDKHYLAGLYGQGGSSTFAVSKLSVIATRYADRPTVGFTVVKYLDLDPEKFRTGRYVYLTLDRAVLESPVPAEGFPAGTVVRHFGYDLSRYPQPFGDRSVYGLLNRILFDPILPVFLDNGTFAQPQRRVIKGARNALNGAVDEGDDTVGPKLSHHMPLSTTHLGEWGLIGLEYWVLESPKSGAGQPTRAFVQPRRPIVLTMNGQNHEERPITLVTQDAELPYLGYRLICNVNCDGLTPLGKRTLFVSTREGARKGVLLDLIDKEIVQALKADDDLARLNTEAAEKSYEEQDEEAVLQMRREVAKILRVHGLKLSDVGPLGGSAFEGPARKGPKRHSPRKKLEPLDIHDPPTFVRILWEQDEPIEFYPGLRRYIRIETDANSTWHDPNDPRKSKFNVIVAPESDLRGSGTTALSGGRMRVIVEALSDSKPDSAGSVRIELTRPGLPTLADERGTKIVPEPEGDPEEKKTALPQFKMHPIDRTNPAWAGTLGWSDDPTAYASGAILDAGILHVYYSTEFPKFDGPLRNFEKRDVNLAKAFKTRYETWLAVHSLILWQDQQLAKSAPVPVDGEGKPTEEDFDAEQNRERVERIRIATMASLFAAREVRLGGATGDDGSEDGGG